MYMNSLSGEAILYFTSHPDRDQLLEETVCFLGANS